MLRNLKITPLLGGFLLAACATEPAGPSVAVMPGAGKTFEQFNADDAVCRQFAANRNSGELQTANDKAVESGLIGTVIGAAAGAAVGGRQGAAVGAGTGLVVGSGVGANDSAYGTYSAQRRYDISYEQCMYAKGNGVPGRTQIYRTNPTYTPPPPPNAPPPQ